jgi:L-lactate dehydrogenase complex protein LldF
VKPACTDFMNASRAALADVKLGKAMMAGTMRPYLGAEEAWAETTDRAALRAQARNARERALSKLPELLEKLEANVIARGGKVLWARDGAEANALIAGVCSEHGAKRVVKSKSMITEEIGLNPILQADGVEVVETDLGEYLIQIADDRPSHIVAPVLHKSKETIGELLHDKLGMPPTTDAGEMMRFARKILREKFLSADLGISGANFGVAETGAVCLITNEGNGRMCTTMPRVHIAVMGLERVVDSWEDAATLVQVLPRAANGQRISTYLNIIHGARQQGEPDGPEHFYLLILDNGRSRVLETQYAQALCCIRCGACLNACPVYRRIGGHAYGWVYPGPIGSVISPLLLGFSQAPDLPMASSLCGACKEACPVDIDLPDLLVRLRREPPMRARGGTVMRLGMRAWAWAMSHPSLYRFGSRFARLGLRPFSSHGVVNRGPSMLGHWTHDRDMALPATRSFRDLYASSRRHSQKDGKL